MRGNITRTGSLLPDFQFPDHRTAPHVTTDCVYGTRVRVIRFTKDTETTRDTETIASI